MVMNPLLRRSILGGLYKRSALIDSDNKWEDGIVPYDLDSSLCKLLFQSFLLSTVTLDPVNCFSLTLSAIPFFRKLGQLNVFS